MSLRKSIFWLHLISGVVAGLVILIMSVTGVLLTYQRQITAWIDPSTVAPPVEGTPRMKVEDLLGKVRAVETGLPSAITVSSDPTAATAFSFGREKVIFVNPYTGEIVGEGSKKLRAFFQGLIEWHRYLGTDGDNRPIGKAVTGASNLAFLFLVVSGFYLWWPRKLTARAFRAVTTFDFSLSGKARDWNWHNVFGFWSAFPLFIVVFTAIFFSYSWSTPLLYKAMGEEPPPPRGGGKGASGSSAEKPKESPPELPGLDGHWATAAGQVEGWQTVSLRMPDSATAPLVFTVDRGNGARPDLRATFTINARTGGIEKAETYDSNSPARKVRLWIRWLHTGEAGGIIGQTIAGLASAAGAVLVWTGLALAFRRFFKRTPRAMAASEPELANTR